MTSRLIDEYLTEYSQKDVALINRIVGLWVSVSHDPAAVPDACAYAGNTCLREHYMYGSHIISWLFIRILLT